eukprot:6592825-Pyramimonas_sp.AAC.1
MGVLVPTGDMTAVKRTAQFFLNSFYERLEVQSVQKATQGEEYNKEFKAPRTKGLWGVECTLAVTIGTGGPVKASKVISQIVYLKGLWGVECTLAVTTGTGGQLHFRFLLTLFAWLAAPICKIAEKKNEASTRGRMFSLRRS